MRVKDAVFKSAQKFCVIHALIAQVKGVVGEAEPFMVFHCFQRTMRRSNVESDFGRVHFDGEIHVERVENVQYRKRALSKIVKPLLKEILTRWGKCVAGMPDWSQ